MKNKELKKPTEELNNELRNLELNDDQLEQLDVVTGGFTNEDHTFTMEPGVINPGTVTVEPGKIIAGVTALESGVGIEPYVMELNFTTRPSDPLTR